MASFWLYGHICDLDELKADPFQANFKFKRLNNVMGKLISRLIPMIASGSLKILEGLQIFEGVVDPWLTH